MKFIRHTNAIDLLYQNLDLIIQKYNNTNHYFIMFGTNKLASMIIYYLEIHNIKVQAIIDNDRNKQGNLIFNLPVYSPESLCTPFLSNAIILIASSYQDDMIAQLEKMNYIYKKHILKVIDLPEAMNDFSFFDRTGYVPMTKKDIKKTQLGILKHLKEICEKYNLKYFLSDGTLLGAVRHKGFIPWDDDIDVFIEFKDLKKLIEIMKDDKQYALISIYGNDDYYDDCSLMVDTFTIADINHFPMQITSGVSIDIFTMTGVPDSDKEFKSFITQIKKLELDYCNKLYNPKECNAAIQNLINFMSKYSFEDYPRAGNILSPYFEKDVFPKEYLMPVTFLEFEGELFAAPNQYKQCLEQVYGNYMEYPPIEKRVGHHYYRAYYKK